MKSYSILIVDDDKDLRELMAEYLEDEGFVTFQAENGDIAFKHIEHEKPDLILLDIEMPAGSGLDVCRILNAHHSTSDIPVIFVTGSISLSNMRSGYLAGAKMFLDKPFALDELGESVFNVLYEHDMGGGRIPGQPCRISA